MKTMTWLHYVKQELGITSQDLLTLTKEQRDSLKQDAIKEMAVLGIPLKEPAQPKSKYR